MTTTGEAFAAADVVAAYARRPPYPPALYEALLRIAPQRTTLVDLGCGPGKIARVLAPHFERVVAVDPSREMLAAARRAPGGDATNIAWQLARAEDAELPATGISLIVAAASVHWMQHDVLFPCLASLAQEAPFAVVDGDTAHEPTWEPDWQRFLGDWVSRITGAPFSSGSRSRFEARMNAYRRWLHVEADEHFLGPEIEQSIDEFIECQHSRATFTAQQLGEQAARFDDELRELLAPHAQDGLLRYRVRSTLVYGRIAPAPNPDRR